MAETRDSLRRQADFRHHHQRLATLRQHVFKDAQIHFRFARAGDPGQQPGGKAVRGAVNRAHGGGLFGVKTQALAGYREACAPVGDGRRFAGQFRQAFTPQRLQGGVVKFQFGDLMAPDLPLTQRRQRLLLFR